jgi:alpha-beta hydrolase superfamily lysophospholipase
MTIEHFQAKRTSVVVTLLSGRNVPIENYNRTKGDAYIIISLDAGDDKKDDTSDHRFTTKTNTTDPVWNERAWLTCVGNCMSLTARVYDDNGPLLWDTSLGTASIRLQDGEHTISLFGGTYSFTVTLLTNRQTTLVDRNSYHLPMTVIDKGTYILEEACRPGNRSVVLWIPGRNDVFMHPHVAKVMLDQGYDICVYNSLGSLRVTPDASHVFVSHVPSGSFDGLIGEMDAVVDHLSTYTNVVVYAHSTGATILANYLLETEKDHVFRAIYLNSPFFEWGNTGRAVEMVLRCAPFMMDCLKLPSSLVLQQGATFDTWHARIHTQHEYDVVNYHSHQTVHMTLGFAAAAQRVFDKLKATHTKRQMPVSTVPVCMITVRNDDVLDSVETIQRTAWLGPPDHVQNLIMDHGSHDVFLSPVAQEVHDALHHLHQFLNWRT